MTTKRRTLWFTDDQWTALVERATAAGMNVSQLIRYKVLDDGQAEAEKWRSISGGVIPKATGNPQAERDAILRRINKGG